MNPEQVSAQYRTPKKLSTRISIHEKYSTNPQPFSDWLMSHYEIHPNDRILELGCGTGELWRGRLEGGGFRLTLTDASPGMLEAARNNTRGDPNVDYQRVDIQEIPFPDASFDTVIANMMLYHVPDLDRGLSQVRRVLKPGGRFYCATYGEHGIQEFIQDALMEYHIRIPINRRFTLQNGGAILAKYFSTVERLTRQDGLAIRHLPDFVDYALSGLSVTAPADLLLEAFQKRCVDGVLYVPKEYGMFVCGG